MENCYVQLFKLCVCRLCLKMVPSNNFSVLTEDNKTVLKIFIPEMNVHVTVGLKICNICTTILKTADQFRKEYFNHDGQKINSNDENLCALCQKDNVDVLKEQDGIRLKDALHTCFPDLEIDFKETSTCCKVCSRLLEELLAFVKNCQKTEENIRSYYLTTGKDLQLTNILEEVFQFVSSNSTKVLAGKNSTKEIQTESGSNENVNTPKEKRRRHSKKIKPTNRYDCTSCSYSINYKSALISHMVSHRTLSEISFRCEICNHQTKRKADLRAHMIIHRDPAELKRFKCKQCPYESKRNGDLKQHMRTHSTTTYKCRHCPFQTPHERYLKKIHMLKHTDKSELKFFNCEKCPYRTANRYCFYTHAETHRFSKWFKCNWCAYTTYRKNSLKYHMVIHTPTPEIEMFKCANCEYETKRKQNLKEHMKRHLPLPLKRQKIKKTQFEEQTFQCFTCGFVTSRKYYIRSHIVHKHH